MQETNTRTAEKVRKSREKRRPRRKGIGSKTSKEPKQGSGKTPLGKTPYLPPDKRTAGSGGTGVSKVRAIVTVTTHQKKMKNFLDNPLYPDKQNVF